MNKLIWKNDLGIWYRQCPSCLIDTAYSTYNSAWKAKYYNRICKTCTDNKILHKLNDFRWGTERRPLSVPCSKCGVIRQFKNRESARAAERTKSKCMMCVKTDETLNNNRRARCLQRAKQFGSNLNYNKQACRIFDEINKELDWNGQHAENGGEYHINKLGYSVDYYEPNLNIVIEYDEPYHKKQIEKDKIRQLKIQKHLGCKFYRLSEIHSWRKVLNEYAQ